MRLKVSDVCQLLDKSKFSATNTLNGVTWTNNGDGTITTSGNANSEGSWLNIDGATITLINAHKYLLSGCPSGGSVYTYWLRLSPIAQGNPKDVGSGVIFTATQTMAMHPLLQVNPGYGDNFLWKPQLFDLTEMYGAGNEPTTVAQFRQDFPDEMYDYSPVCWKKFRRLKYVANKEPIQLYDKTLPATQTINGVTFTNNGDGSVTVNGTATATARLPIRELIDVNPGDKFLMFSGYDIGNKKSAFVYMAQSGANKQYIAGFGYPTLNGIFRTCADNAYYIYGYVQVDAGNTAANAIIKLQIFNLTQMYGAGNEPTTVAQFRADYPNELYDYNPYNFLTLNRGKYIANKEPVQLLDNSKYPATGTSNGITYTKNEDGSYDVNGTIVSGTSLSTLYVVETELKKDHWYLNNLRPDNSQKSYVECKVYIRAESKFIFPGARFKMRVDNCYSRQTLLVNGISFGAGTVISDEKLYPELFDLTEMFGEGNEPTEEEFWATYSKTTMYDYNPYNAITFR